jgi:4-alpha-glucanotransferase
VKNRDPAALTEFRQQNQEAIMSVYWQQYQLYQRWQEVREYATKKGIYLFGDMPIFVAHDSSDVWANQSCFLLDEQGMPTVVAGVPPDYFSETGQRWGNPHYNWDEMRKNGYSWWLKRLQNHLQCFDVVRIDHFRGLEAVWVIDAEQETAVEGSWQEVPGNEMLQALQDELGIVPLVAEDLGIITEKVTALREAFQLPGMSVLQFSFDESEDNPHKPVNITHDRIVYTGTHDNDTTNGWFWSLDEDTRQYVMRSMQIEDPSQACDRLIDIALESKAQLAVIPMQDLLSLGSDSRMNIPGTVDGNWRWQFSWDQVADELASDLKRRVLEAGRSGS